MNIFKLNEIEKNQGLFLHLFKKSIKNGNYMSKCIECIEIFYIFNEKTLKNINILDKVVDIVMLYVFPNEIVEIYFISVNNYEKIRSYIDFVNKKFPKHKIVIGISVFNPNIEMVVDSVVSQGYCCPKVSYKNNDTLPGKIPILYLNDGKHSGNVSKSSSKSICKIASKLGFSSQSTCPENYIFSLDDINYIRKFLDDRIEYAGAFNHSIPDGNKNDVILLLDKNSIKKGDEHSQTVNLSVSPYSFHTHPTLFYKTGDNPTFSGWFSGTDVKYLLINSNKGMKTHFLFTIEGIYSLGLTPEFSKALKLMSIRNRKNLINTLVDRFINLEDKRKAINKKNISKINKDTISQFADFFKTVNSMVNTEYPTITKLQDDYVFKLFCLDFAFNDNIDSYIIKR